jgi:large subunit ribosomal protein L23
MSGMSKERLMNVLIGPYVSEKQARISEHDNAFVFRVRRDATKPDIKAAVELMFEVKVADVNVVNVGGKQKRFGQRLGRRQDFKKAYVRLAPGQKIDQLSGSEA